MMDWERIRHVPVVERGHLVGIISIGDTVKAQHDELDIINTYLPEPLDEAAIDALIARTIADTGVGPSMASGNHT